MNQSGGNWQEWCWYGVRITASILMKASDIFSLAIRLAGLWLLFTSLPGLPSAFFKLCTSVFELKLGAAFQLIVSVGWTYAVAFWLLLGAPWIQRKAYPNGFSSES